MAHKISVILAAFVIGFLIGVIAVNLTHPIPKANGFTSDGMGAISPYHLPVPLAAQDYNSLHRYTRSLSCSDCFRYGLQSAQSDALFAIHQNISTPAQRVLPDAIAAWNGYYNDNSPSLLLPVHMAFVSAAARIYASSLRGAAHCATNCPVTKDDTAIWANTPSHTIAQIWCAIAMWRGVATTTQKLIYAASIATKLTSDQVELLKYSEQDIALADAKTASAPSRAQVALLAASAAILAGKATAAQNSYFLGATPYAVAQFDTALTSAKADTATADQKALIASMPPA